MNNNVNENLNFARDLANGQLLKTELAKGSEVTDLENALLGTALKSEDDPAGTEPAATEPIREVNTISDLPFFHHDDEDDERPPLIIYGDGNLHNQDGSLYLPEDVPYAAYVVGASGEIYDASIWMELTPYIAALMKDGEDVLADGTKIEPIQDAPFLNVGDSDGVPHLTGKAIAYAASDGTLWNEDGTRYVDPNTGKEAVLTIYFDTDGNVYGLDKERNDDVLIYQDSEGDMWLEDGTPVMDKTQFLYFDFEEDISESEDDEEEDPEEAEPEAPDEAQAKPVELHRLYRKDADGNFVEAGLYFT